MNKVTKGTLAAAAAGTLLLGGVGTYATWSDEASLNAGNVSTGVLTLNAASTQGWSYDGGATTVTNPDIVPGDKLTAIYNVGIVAEGDNLEGSFSLEGIDQQDLPEGVTVNIAPAAEDTEVAGLQMNGDDITFTGDKTYDFNVVITVDFPEASEAGQNGTINLAGAELVLTQS